MLIALILRIILKLDINDFAGVCIHACDPQPAVFRNTKTHIHPNEKGTLGVQQPKADAENNLTDKMKTQLKRL